MIPYVLIYLLIAFLAFDSIYFKRNFKYIVIIFTIFLGIFSGSRSIDLGGYDTWVYSRFYSDLPLNITQVLNSDEKYIIKFEKGYTVLNIIGKSLGLNFNQFLLLLGIICSSLLILPFKRYSNYYFFSVLIFLSKGYLYYFFTAQRQVIAMMICWIALKYLDNRNKVIFFLLILLAVQFHTSSIFFVLIYFLTKIRLTNKIIYMSILVSILFGFSNLGVVLSQQFSVFFPQDAFSNKLNTYVENSTVGINILNYFEMIPILYLVIKNKDQLEQKSPYFNTILWLFLLFYCLTFAFYNINSVSRLKGYFVIGYIIIISNLISTRKSYKKYYYFLIILGYCLAVYLREILVFSGGTGYFPYRSFLLQ